MFQALFPGDDGRGAIVVRRHCAEHVLKRVVFVGGVFEKGSRENDDGNGLGNALYQFLETFPVGLVEGDALGANVAHAEGGNGGAVMHANESVGHLVPAIGPLVAGAAPAPVEIIAGHAVDAAGLEFGASATGFGAFVQWASLHAYISRFRGHGWCGRNDAGENGLVVFFADPGEVGGVGHGSGFGGALGVGVVVFGGARDVVKGEWWNLGSWRSGGETLSRFVLEFRFGGTLDSARGTYGPRFIGASVHSGCPYF